ncbi:MAG: iron donor protein CyaY [Alphaproteobacteria bacterium]|nr:iron donor protein CyaY [Alphaproteobacteria bacterium]
MEIISPSYQTQASETMESIADMLETHYVLEIDYDGNALQIHLPDGKQYLINFHGITNQLWLSSPFSGAHHFDYKEGSWQSTRMDINLNTILKTEFQNQLGYSLDF